MAFVFDKRKVDLSGLACELVVPAEQLTSIGEDALDRQFARTPYAVSFRCGTKTFILTTLHVLYGDRSGDRVPELKAIAQWLADWARDINAWDHNLIALGDFNIDRAGDALYKAFTSTGLVVPQYLRGSKLAGSEPLLRSDRLVRAGRFRRSRSFVEVPQGRKLRFRGQGPAITKPQQDPALLAHLGPPALVGGIRNPFLKSCDRSRLRWVLTEGHDRLVFSSSSRLKLMPSTRKSAYRLLPDRTDSQLSGRNASRRQPSFSRSLCVTYNGKYQMRGVKMMGQSVWARLGPLALGGFLLGGDSLQATQDPLGHSARQVLERNCLSCHAGTAMSGLDIRTREGLLKGGKRGPAIVPGHANQSLLYLAASHQGDLKMPPGRETALPEEDLALLRNWIDSGAWWGQDPVLQESKWWSFRRLRRPEVPLLESGAQPANPIDAFVGALLEAKGLQPAPPADRLRLVRRAYFDLIGLPPRPDQIRKFIEDKSPHAYETLIEELLASPHYGERWARHWLDVVRYSDSSGFEGDVYYPNAWRYRDYVIKSFNEDKPYDRFVQEQVAGDELWPNNLDLEGFYDVPLEKLEHLEARVGTGVYTFGPEVGESHLDALKLRYERQTDWVNTTGSAFLGLSLQCARCHDHKFDPLTQQDYFRMQAVFAPSIPTSVPVVTTMSKLHWFEGYPFVVAVDEARQAYRAFETGVRERAIQEKKKDFPPQVVRAYEIPEGERTEEQAALAASLAKLYTEMKISEVLKGEEVEQYRELRERIAASLLAIPEKDGSHQVRFDAIFDVPSASALGHVEAELIGDTHVLDRGELERPREKVTPGLPRALNYGAEAFDLNSDEVGLHYRKQLALWLTQPQHPLTARVFVNRLWQWHFGYGIVRTTNDLGTQGALPTHPELLDWLASELVDRGWSIKSLHRLIMLSQTYQRSSRFANTRNQEVDSENRYLWRMNRRRLESEAIWDAIHAAAGTLNLKMGGRPVLPPLSEVELAPLRHKEWWVTPANPADGRRRAVYILARRNFTFPMFDKFDRPNSSESCARREVTTVAPQLLWILNNDMVFRQAQALADRVRGEAGQQPDQWVDLAWQLTLGRPANPREQGESVELLRRLEQMDADSPEHRSEDPEERKREALTQLCLTLFNLNEFVYVD